MRSRSSSPRNSVRHSTRFGSTSASCAPIRATRPLGDNPMPELINESRRRIVGGALMTFAATRFPAVSAATTFNAFGPLRQIDAGVLSVAYAEAGPADGRPVILL